MCVVCVRALVPSSESLCFGVFLRRPEVLKHEMKVFFVKYNDPIYVKLEKLDIMIRLASQANIAQVTSHPICPYILYCNP